MNVIPACSYPSCPASATTAVHVAARGLDSRMVVCAGHLADLRREAVGDGLDLLAEQPL